jgi:MOSC domain-containing protein
MRVASLHTYPIKGCHRIDHDRAVVEPWGLAGDRRWLLIEPDGTFVTQRDEPRLALLQVAETDSGLDLSAKGTAALGVPVPETGETIKVRVWQSEVDATPVGGAADAWLSAFLERDVRLVWLDDPTRRTTDPLFSGPDDRVSFADGFPLLVTATASLDRLGEWIGRPLPMTRFRPNLVVETEVPFVEDTWLGRRLRIGDVVLRVVKPCGRCIVTTTDQETGEREREPLRTLARYRNFDQRLVFGVNLVPDSVGELAIGDEVSVL